MSDIEVDKYYKREAKELIEFLFDRRFLNDNLSKTAIDVLEDYVGFLFQSRCEMSAKAAVLTASMRDIKGKKK